MRYVTEARANSFLIMSFSENSARAQEFNQTAEVCENTLVNDKVYIIVPELVKSYVFWHFKHFQMISLFVS